MIRFLLILLLTNKNLQKTKMMANFENIIILNLPLTVLASINTGCHARTSLRNVEKKELMFNHIYSLRS